MVFIFYYIFHKNPIRRITVAEIHPSEFIPIAVCHSYPKTSASTYPTVAGFVFVKGGYTRSAYEVTIIRKQVLYFLAFAVNEKSAVISAEPYFSVSPLDDGVYRRDGCYIGKFGHMRIERQLSCGIVLAGESVGSYSQPYITFRVYKQGFHRCGGNILVLKVETMADK